VVSAPLYMTIMSTLATSKSLLFIFNKIKIILGWLNGGCQTTPNDLWVVGDPNINHKR
jgi:hypothetical protein